MSTNNPYLNDEESELYPEDFFHLTHIYTFSGV